MTQSIFQNPQTQAIITYIEQTYGDKLEFLWPKFPQNAIWRNQKNQKWYALLLVVPRGKLIGAKGDPTARVEILDLRFNKGEALDFAESHPGIYPGYHMNKRNWITVILNDSIPTSEIMSLIDNSYRISLDIH